MTSAPRSALVDKVTLCIYGSRTMKNNVIAEDAIERGLKELGLRVEDISLVIDGKAPGADNQGHFWAKGKLLRTRRFPAAWSDIGVPGAVIRHNKYGPYNAVAGHMRNQQMAEFATHFIGLRMPGESTGTDDMTRRVRGLNKPLALQLL